MAGSRGDAQAWPSGGHQIGLAQWKPPERKRHIMNTLQSCAVALLLAVSTGISATALAQTAQIFVDRDSCINSNNAATPEPAIAACTRLLEALARGEISGPEGAAVHVARGNLHAVQGDVERAIGDYDRAITFDPNRAVGLLQPRWRVGCERRTRPRPRRLRPRHRT